MRWELISKSWRNLLKLLNLKPLKELPKLKISSKESKLMAKVLSSLGMLILLQFQSNVLTNKSTLETWSWNKEKRTSTSLLEILIEIPKQACSNKQLSLLGLLCALPKMDSYWINLCKLCNSAFNSSNIHAANLLLCKFKEEMLMTGSNNSKVLQMISP